MEILNLRVKECVVNLAGMAEADIGEHVVKGPQGDVCVCTGEGPRADICECGGEVPKVSLVDVKVKL